MPPVVPAAATRGNANSADVSLVGGGDGGRGASDAEHLYRCKRVRLHGAHTVSIVLQDRNGPCPLIAITNALVLRGNLDVGKLLSSSSSSSVSFESLCLALTEYLFTTHASLLQVRDAHALDVQQNLSEVVNQMPQLQRGADVNVGFGSCDSYELTRETLAFDAFRVRLLHGWLPDDDDDGQAKGAGESVRAVIGDKKYNSLVDTMVEAASEQQQQQEEQQSGECGAAGSELARDAPEPGSDSGASSMAALQREARIIERFLAQTSSQLTYRGLCELHGAVKENEFAVFFRNNHCSTITKRNGSLYLLVADEGFADEPRVVWEQLIDIGGDSIFVDGTFRPSFDAAAAAGANAADVTAAATTTTKGSNAGSARAEMSNDDNDDLALARELQQQENARMAHATAAGRAQSAPPPPPPSSSSSSCVPGTAANQSDRGRAGSAARNGRRAPAATTAAAMVAPSPRRQGERTPRGRKNASAKRGTGTDSNCTIM